MSHIVDFKKDFDLVDHQILLSELKLHVIERDVLNWFKTYLTHRQQQVSINCYKSDFETVTLELLRVPFLEHVYLSMFKHFMWIMFVLTYMQMLLPFMMYKTLIKRCI